MDIRSIIDPEPSTTTSNRPILASKNEPRPLAESSSQSFQNINNAPLVGHQPSRDSRPPQPPPLQAPAHNDFRSLNASSYQSAPSPYQPTPYSGHGGQYPFPQNASQSPSHGAPGPQYTQRDGQSAPLSAGYPPYRQSTPLSQTPTATTPGSAQTYFNQPRPQSSHSASTPTSAQAHASNFPRQSPSTSQSQTRAPSQNFPSQQYLSQPSTPLGPPQTFGRANASARRDSPGSYGHHRNHSGSSYGHPPLLAHSPTSEHPGSFRTSPSSSGPRQPQPSYRDHSMSVERERSLSVSPKTRLPSQPRIDVSRAIEVVPGLQPAPLSLGVTVPSHGRPSTQTEHEPLSSQGPSRSFSLGVNGLLNSPMMNDGSRQINESAQHLQKRAPRNIAPSAEPYSAAGASEPPESSVVHASTARSQGPVTGYPSIPSNQPSQQTYQAVAGHLPLAPNQSHFPTVPSHLTEHKAPQLPQQLVADSKVGPSTMAPKQIELEQTEPPVRPLGAHDLPKPKKRRHEEPPIYAQSSRKNCRGNPFLAKNKPAPGRLGPAAKEALVSNKALVSQNNQQSLPAAEVNGHAPNADGIRLPPTQPAMVGNGPLGAWEPSILNMTPSEEVTRVLSDFLFTEVVMRDDVGVAPAGGGKTEGAVLEIEAKIGQLIDKNTNDRIHFPVMSECVVCKSDPNVRIAFKSSMTEAQHRTLNQFLNQALIGSKAPPRIPMDYVHTYEIDTFYDMSQSGALNLPKSIRSQIDPRNPRTIPKVRVTHNRKTGEEIAKIVKARVADIDIYSPRTAFDWRVSVNVEMRINGDLKDLIEPGTTGKRGADRNKDRMSYRHLAYQIDLTQVTGTDAANKTDKEHELEIEVASQEVRRQGQLARDGKVSQYEELIRGFADNVRILARHCQ